MTAPRFRHDVVAGRVPGAEPPLLRPDGRPLEVPAAAADLTVADQAALAAHLAARRVAAALDADRVGLPRARTR